MKVAAYETHKLAEAYIKQEKLIKADNVLFVIKLSIQSDKVNDKVDIEDFEVNIAIKASEVPKAIIMIYINLITYNTTNLLTHIDKFKTDFINLSLFEIFIVTKAPEAPEALETGNATTVDLTINITTELFIQSDEVLLNQATAPHHQGTCVRQPIKHTAEVEALRQCK